MALLILSILLSANLSLEMLAVKWKLQQTKKFQPWYFIETELIKGNIKKIKKNSVNLVTQIGK